MGGNFGVQQALAVAGSGVGGGGRGVEHAHFHAAPRQLVGGGGTGNARADNQHMFGKRAFRLPKPGFAVVFRLPASPRLAVLHVNRGKIVAGCGCGGARQQPQIAAGQDVGQQVGAGKLQGAAGFVQRLPQADFAGGSSGGQRPLRQGGIGQAYRPVALLRPVCQRGGQAADVGRRAPQRHGLAAGVFRLPAHGLSFRQESSLHRVWERLRQ